MQWCRWGLNPRPPLSHVKHSTTELLRSLKTAYGKWFKILNTLVTCQKGIDKHCGTRLIWVFPVCCSTETKIRVWSGSSLFAAQACIFVNSTPYNQHFFSEHEKCLIKTFSRNWNPLNTQWTIPDSLYRTRRKNSLVCKGFNVEGIFWMPYSIT